MPLDPELLPFIAAMEAAYPVPAEQLPHTVVRARVEELSAASRPPRPSELQVEDRVIAQGVKVRLYRHREAAAPMPALVYFHGGGWVVGSIDTHDGVAAALARDLKGLVVSVDYRLAPEHPFPAGLEDCFAATGWVGEEATQLGVDAARIAVGGDSAGGTLAAGVCLMARDRGGPKLAFQMLNYPVTDCNLNTLSYIQLADGPLLRRSAMAWYWRHYVGGDGFTRNPLAAPLQAEDLTGLPPALVTAAEYDCLRDEAAAFAAKLQRAGVPTEYRLAPGLIHGYLRFTAGVKAARSEYQAVAAALCRALAKKQPRRSAAE
ncbi:MAG: alpha/beta hydrolase [Proteobacteria bacterium]|nr:alpha/beta hydrolase [Pseudomonadota bacterium]MBI3497545.1 alpha/beta hydrolase [Pseudomonadota bacterium]